MPSWALLISHAVKLAVLLTLVFLFARGHHRLCWSFPAYLLAVLVTSVLMSFWPAQFYTHEFYLLSQSLYDLLKLLVGVELAHRIFRNFPGARPLVLTIVLALLVVTSVGFLAIPTHGPYHTWFQWQPRIVTSTVWLFTGTTFLVLWFRVPVRRWHRDIILGFTPYLLVFVTLLGILRDHGWGLRELIGALDGLAYLCLVTWWAWAAARPQERPDLSPAVAKRLGLETA